MARIRTVKPELWTDPDFVECTSFARLLFVASLNFASDFGVLPDKPAQLKMQCLPADSIDVEPLIRELIDRRFYVRAMAPNGDRVIVIRTFNAHQRVNRPNAGRWGNPAEWSTYPQGEDSVSAHGGLTEDSVSATNHQVDAQFTEDSVSAHGGLTEDSPPEGKGRDSSEGKGRELRNTDSSSSNLDSRRATTTTSERIEIVYGLIADAQIDRAGTIPTHPEAYRGTVLNTIARQHGERVRQWLDTHPDAPPTLAANALLLEIA